MHEQGMAGSVAKAFINSKLTPLFIAASVLLGLGAVATLPREEEPQIVVPMVDIFVEMPGADAAEVERRVTGPMERLLWEIPGVEYLYTTSSPGRAMAIVRFYVGENEEDAIVRLNQKMFANFDLIPPGAGRPLIKPRSIDDVPILALTLWSDSLDHYSLRRVAAEVYDRVKQTPNVSEVRIIGGPQRSVRVLPDSEALAARGLTLADINRRLGSANSEIQAGEIVSRGKEIAVDARGFLRTAADVEHVVVGVHQGKPVYVGDVAEVIDGPGEVDDYVLFSWGAGAEHSHLLGEADTSSESDRGPFPAVTVSIAKRKGTNATQLAHKILSKVEALRGELIPAEVHVSVTRNYGETAREKSDELLFHMLLAILSVSVLIWIALGMRESWIVAIAIPVTLALTLVVFGLYGYTLNRVTLFALIFSIGILVDDAIVVVENIVRHYRLPENRGRGAAEIATRAVAEVGNPTILATFAVIAAILPMAFVRGLMGPYMRPIPVGASAAMLFSLLVAFVVTPWAAVRLLKRHADRGGGHSGEDWTTRLYRGIMAPLIHRPLWRWGFLSGTLLLFAVAASLVAFRLVTVKMLPFDNKSEFQVIVDMPEDTTLEGTAALVREIADYLGTVPEVTDCQAYVGTASPVNFNGLVRHYFLRGEPYQADLQVNLAPKDERGAQSHEIAKRVRPEIQRIARLHGAEVKVAEVPPGPPVLQTLVAEVYGPDAQRQVELAQRIERIFRETEGVVDVDSYIETAGERLRLIVDREKAALHGVTPEQLAGTLRTALSGQPIGLLHDSKEREDVPIVVRLSRAKRSSAEDLNALWVRGQRGLVSVRELVLPQTVPFQRSIYHKNLVPVVYVTGDVAGREESPVYAILRLTDGVDRLAGEWGSPIDQYTAVQPEGPDRWAVKWDGEWHITYEVFRDLGLAFAAVLVLIYILVVGWFKSWTTPLVIMAAIPFSLIGILPAHWLMGAFFTATSMIGFIAGAGIVVRNSIILVDFIELRLNQGMALDQAVIDAGAVRFRPMMLTAAAVVVGASVILFDPIFQGLAIALMAGEVASLLLSRMAVPVLYYLSKK